MKQPFLGLRRRWALGAWTLASLLLLPALRAEQTGGDAKPWWSPAAEAALTAAQTNRDEILRTLRQVPADQRAGAEFLVTNMPAVDVRSLSAKFLLENLALAYRARNETPWGRAIPEDVFLNDVLPYALLNEPRDPWRAKLWEICLPLVKDCQKPGEAAHRLNQRLFPLVKVKYSTARKRPDQSPIETMDSGIATCSGLSILWADACRAVGIPARVAGTPMWSNGSGNHTWVEVWDQDWHFGGAAEPDDKGLDHGWFVGNASQAVKDNARNAIYASSFKPTGLAFPLVWARRIDWVPGVNVTDRYTAGAKPAAPEQARLLVRVYDHPAGKRARGGRSRDGSRRRFGSALRRQSRRNRGSQRRARLPVVQEARLPNRGEQGGRSLGTTLRNRRRRRGVGLFLSGPEPRTARSRRALHAARGRAPASRRSGLGTAPSVGRLLRRHRGAA